ncbi:LysR family transcriptional regulator [Streptococcus himalayensis]|uniref:LysR family transcriptional regulator n=1 Tax=Streptococcus himalayensis TaxID=1888195 RepID=A0A917A871_9STRE|nr:LysR family transcriptional regulator [Streptococcus himalayensis]GGE33338.1 LysR family transcriptional regulator [Streptococcus himalayensis]
MNIRVLHYFVTIVQTKSISNAAQALHITQPTLSRQIQELEEDLGTRLFHRGNREITLTDDGQYLYNRAIEILSLVEKTENNIRGAKDLAGEIYIGTAETQSFDIVARAIKLMTNTYPNTKIHLRSGNSDDILEYLNQGVYDMGIIIGPYDSKKYEHIPLPSRDQWGVLVPKDHPLTKLKHPSLADVLNFPLIVSSQTTIDYSIFAGLGDYRIVATYNLLYNASTLVKEGVGIALALDGIIQTDFDHSQLAFIPLSLPTQDTLQLIWKKQSKQSNLVKKFLQILSSIL